mmetsp:Transcript_176803/g.567092  ORF Transcript_176803/g.567092 Transcript_176803/m.567092 type:complete len:242 (-) Transcript_176803:284-1009(-)
MGLGQVGRRDLRGGKRRLWPDRVLLDGAGDHFQHHPHNGGPRAQRCALVRQREDNLLSFGLHSGDGFRCYGVPSGAEVRRHRAQPRRDEERHAAEGDPRGAECLGDGSRMVHVGLLPVGDNEDTPVDRGAGDQLISGAALAHRLLHGALRGPRSGQGGRHGGDGRRGRPHHLQHHQCPEYFGWLLVGARIPLGCRGCRSQARLPGGRPVCARADRRRGRDRAVEAAYSPESAPLGEGSRGV